jgi:hypothetical protein
LALSRGVFFPSRSEIDIHRDWRLRRGLFPLRSTFALAGASAMQEHFAHE